MNEKIFKIQELDVEGKRVFVRVDFNVPLKVAPGGKLEVAEGSRIEGALKTIRYLIERGGKCILASHLGRPQGRVNKKYSLEPVGERLSELLHKDVLLTDDCIGDGPKGLSHQMRAGEVMLLENLRFHSGEEENSVEFAHKLAELCELYVSDAFGTLHRAHASTSALPHLMAQRGIGFLVQDELKYLAPLRENPKRPFLLILGGAKVSDKLGIIEYFMPKIDRLVIGGAMAYAFLRAESRGVGKSLCDEGQVEIAKRILGVAADRNVEVLLPLDHLVTSSLQEVSHLVVTPGPDIPDEKMGVDIGPKTLAKFEAALNGAETIFWNGPMGVFEIPAFASGTTELARKISQTKAKKLAGGGDSAAAIANAGCASQFDFISTGGGATLEYLEGKELPGLKVLEVSLRSS